MVLLAPLGFVVEVGVEMGVLSCWTLSGATATGLEPSVCDGLAGLAADADPESVLAGGLDAIVSEPAGLEPLPPDPGAPAGEDGEEVLAASATGQTVVEMAMISVVTDPTLAGQSVTVAAHEVIVYTVVL